VFNKSLFLRVAAVPLVVAACGLVTVSMAVACTGDCDGDGTVTVNELLVGVNIALGNAMTSACPSFDSNGDGDVTIDELLAAVNNALGSCPPAATPTMTVATLPSATATVPSTPTVTSTPSVTGTPTATVVVTPIFPANYLATYTVVRDCRFSSEHGLVYVRVLANSIGAQPYLADANPLPVGSTIVKEEFSGADCNPNSLVRWRAMRKEAPGFDAVDGDWHWQWVNADRSVLLNDKSTCIGCHTVPACLARDLMCTVGAAPRGTLQLILSRQPASLMSISGTSATDVYAVGADPGDGFGPYVLHYDGSTWQRLNTGVSGDLWWISVAPIDGQFYMAGVNGIVLRYDPQTNHFSTFTTPGMETLFGIWGTSASDLWAVGGNPTDESGGGVLWHFDGITWSAVDLSGLFPGGVPTLYKVWGRSVTDIYAVAGTGLQVFDGDGKPAQQTSLYFPLEVTFDSQGRPLIVDWNNLRIRRIDNDGTVETIMGLSYEGSPVEGALAVDTPLHHASDVTFDFDGNLYVAGDHVPLVMRVGLDARVSIVAGTADIGDAGDEGPAVQANLNIPFGVLPDGVGGFYIADVGANVVRYVDANGTIHRFAGNGTRGYGGDGQAASHAQLNGPTRMRFDANGRLCFCDTNNHAVRCVDTSGTIATVAGNGTSGYSGDHAAAIHAQLATPYDLRFAPDGDLYIADTGNSVIRRVDTGGTITTVVGTGTPNFAGDAGAAASCQLNRPSGVSFAGDGSMWISDTFNNRVRRVAQFLN